MTQPYDDDEDGDPDPTPGDGSPSVADLVARARAARNDAWSAVGFMLERYDIRGLAALINVIDEQSGTYSDIYLERRQVEDYVFERYNLYVPGIWDDVVDSERFREMTFEVRDYTRRCIPWLVEEIVSDDPRT